VRDESARVGISRNLEAPNNGRYEITRIWGPNLIFILKLEIKCRVLVSGKRARRG
jgi:hypothetical protein